MKYYYSKVSYFSQVVLGVLILIPFLIFVKNFFAESDFKDFLKLILCVILGLAVLVISGSRKWLNKYVELKTNHIYFHAYRDGISIDNYEVKYADIALLSADTSPFIGIKNITISLNNGDSFEISHSFCNFKELCLNLISILQNGEYNAKICDTLQIYYVKSTRTNKG